MAIQAQMYPDNLGLPLLGGGGVVGGGGLHQDWFQINNVSNITNDTNNNMFNGCGLNEISVNNLQQQKQQQYQFQQQQQQQQQQALLQLQQQYLLQLQNQQLQQQRNDGFVFMSRSKNCNPTTTTATTTTAASTTTSGSCDYQLQIPVSFSSGFADQIDKHSQEVDRLITLQNEKLRLTLQEQRKQQLAAILRKLEAKAMQLVRQKDDEIARANKRSMDLEEIIRKMEFENLEWQRLASENEAMVVSLNNTLVQLKEQQFLQQGCCLTTASSSCSSNDVDDAQSCYDVDNNDGFSNNKKRRREEEAGEDAKTREKRGKIEEMVMCRVCKTRNSCMLLLPCRHLCCCKGCEGLVDACPVCESDKRASIEALLS